MSHDELVNNIKKDELLDLLSAMIGPYNIPYLISWYEFASTKGKLTIDEFSGKECIHVYDKTADIDMKLILSQTTPLHVWCRDKFVLKFRFEPEENTIESIKDYEMLIKYFESGYEKFIKNNDDPVLSSMSVKVELYNQL